MASDVAAAATVIPATTSSSSSITSSSSVAVPSVSTTTTRARPSKRATAAALPSANAPTSARRNAKDVPHVEEVATVPEEKPIVLTPFDRLPEIWQHHTPDKQRSAVTQIFGLTDAPGVCVEAITVDETYYDLLFAHSSGLNKEQTRMFYTIMVYIRSQLRVIPEVTVEESFSQFRALIMAHSTLASHTRAARNGEHVHIPLLPDIVLPTITVAPPVRPITQASLITVADDNGPLSAKSRAGDSKRGGGITRPSAKTSSVGSTTAAAAAASSSTASHTRSTSRSSVVGDKSSSDDKRPVSRSSLTAAKSSGRPTTSTGDTTSRSTTPRTTTNNPNNASSSSVVSLPVVPAFDPSALDISSPVAAISSSYQLAVAATSLPLPSRWFTPENVKQITDYVSQGLYANYRLYQAVFNPTLFTPNRLPLVHDLLIEAPIIDVRQRLRDAIDLDAEEKKLRDDIARQAADEDRARVEATQRAAAAIAAADMTSSSSAAAGKDGKGSSSVKRERKERPKA